jgi:hypothetical protein
MLFTFGGFVALATVGEMLLTGVPVFHKPVQFLIQSIKPVQDAVNVSMDFGFGDVLFGNFFASAIKEDRDALELICFILQDPTQQTQACCEYDVPNRVVHYA